MGSMLLYEKNKWMGFLGVLCSVSFLRSYLLMLGPKYDLFETSLVGIFIFGIYYAVRHLRLKKDILRWFLLPAVINLAFIFMQAFDHTASFLKVMGIVGLLGASGKAACFLALTTPLFLECMPILLPLLLLGLFICKSSVAMGASLASIMVYLFFKKRKLFNFVAFLLLMVLSLTLVHVVVIRHGDIPWYKVGEVGDIGQRLCFWLGTLDGIKHNPVFGWGIGNFKAIWEGIPGIETRYFLGFHCNYPGHVRSALLNTTIMNHPHNELLLWWWFMGTGFPILFILLCKDLIKKFTVEYIIPFTILVAAFVIMMGYFLSYPSWFLVILTLGVYENREVCNGKAKKGGKNSKGCKSGKRSKGRKSCYA